jgi:DNA helicase HerA-like ATPase
MSAADPILVAKGESDLCLLPQMANRHGLIAGATGTGKTVTLQVLAEGFSSLGVPVFMADVKGDLAGISQPGVPEPKIQKRIQELKLEGFQLYRLPGHAWDVFGENGHPVRGTISEMGPLLLARLLQLNDTQAGVLNLIFRIADENGLLLLDQKDLRAMVQYVGENASAFTTQYGNVSTASVGAIQRNLLALESQGAEKFFAEPALNFDDLLQTDAQGRGMVNIFAADKLMQAPKIYATFLLCCRTPAPARSGRCRNQNWCSSSTKRTCPQTLRLHVPKTNKSSASSVKGVGVYFVSQNRATSLTTSRQLGNRVQHALRAHARDQKPSGRCGNVSAPIETQHRAVLTELGVGEALVSFLDEKEAGAVQRASIIRRAAKSVPFDRNSASKSFKVLWPRPI